MKRKSLFLSLGIAAVLLSLSLGTPCPGQAGAQPLILAQRGMPDLHHPATPSAEEMRKKSTTSAPAAPPPRVTVPPPAPRAAPPPAAPAPRVTAPPVTRPGATRSAIPVPLPKPGDTRSAIPVPLPKPSDTQSAIPVPSIKPGDTRSTDPIPLPKPSDTKSAIPVPLPKPSDTKSDIPLPIPGPGSSLRGIAPPPVRVRALGLSDTRVAVGQRVAVTARIQNPLSSGSSRVRVRFFAGAEPVGREQIISLSPGDSQSVSTMFTPTRGGIQAVRVEAEPVGGGPALSQSRSLTVTGGDQGSVIAEHDRTATAPLPPQYRRLASQTDTTGSNQGGGGPEGVPDQTKDFGGIDSSFHDSGIPGQNRKVPPADPGGPLAGRDLPDGQDKDGRGGSGGGGFDVSMGGRFGHDDVSDGRGSIKMPQKDLPYGMGDGRPDVNLDRDGQSTSPRGYYSGMGKAGGGSAAEGGGWQPSNQPTTGDAATREASEMAAEGLKDISIKSEKDGGYTVSGTDGKGVTYETTFTTIVGQVFGKQSAWDRPRPDEEGGSGRGRDTGGSPLSIQEQMALGKAAGSRGQRERGRYDMAGRPQVEVVGAPAADPDHRDADTPQKRLIPGGPVTSSRGDYRVSTPHDGYGSMASQTGGRGSGSRQAGARWRFGGAATLQGGRGFTGAGASGGSFVTVASVSGKVQTLSRAGGHASWAPLKAGDNLETNSVIRVETGGGNGELGFDQASAGRQSWTRIGGGPDHSVFRLELQH